MSYLSGISESYEIYTYAPYSMWIFLLLGVEAIRTYKTNPYLVIGTHNIPTWISPLVMVVVVKALVPSSSFFGHLSGVATGYLCKTFFTCHLR